MIRTTFGLRVTMVGLKNCNLNNTILNINNKYIYKMNRNEFGSHLGDNTRRTNTGSHVTDYRNLRNIGFHEDMDTGGYGMRLDDTEIRGPDNTPADNTNIPGDTTLISRAEEPVTGEVMDMDPSDEIAAQYCERWGTITEKTLEGGTIRDNIKTKMAAIEFLLEMQVSHLEESIKVGNVMRTLSCVPNRDLEEALAEAINGPLFGTMVESSMASAEHWKHLHMEMGKAMEMQEEVTKKANEKVNAILQQKAAEPPRKI